MVADNLIIPFIRGDGTGVDISATQKVLDAAVAKAYGGSKSIEWFKVYAGDDLDFGTYQYCRRTISGAIHPRRRHQGLLTTPVGGGIRSLGGPARFISRASRRYYAGSTSPQASSGSGRDRPGEHRDIYMGVEGRRRRRSEAAQAPQRGGDPANGKLGKRQIPEGSGIGIAKEKAASATSARRSSTPCAAATRAT